MSSVVVRVDGICCLLSVAIDRSVEPNRKHRVELKALNTPGQLERTDSKYERKRQIIFDVFY